MAAGIFAGCIPEEYLCLIRELVSIMTLRKKMILSNVLTVVLPAAMLLILWAGVVRFSSGTYLKPIRRASEGGDTLTEAMNILYTFEAELSDVDWDRVSFPGENGMESVISPEQGRVEELNSLGYHIQVESAEEVLFSNMDETDLSLLGDVKTKAEGTISWKEGSLVIRDSFRLSGKTYYLTAVYNKNRVDLGVQKSLVPMYMVSPSILLTLVVAAFFCVALTSFILSGWMNRAVLVPLEELKKGADRIAEGDLDHRISYDGKDEFGDVCSEFDHMRLQLKEAKQEQKRYDDQKKALQTSPNSSFPS